MVENLPQKNGCHPSPNLRQMPIGIRLTREGWRAILTPSQDGEKGRRCNSAANPSPCLGAASPVSAADTDCHCNFCGKAASSYAHQPKDFAPKCTTPADRRSGFAVVVPPVRNTILLINKKGKQKMTQTKRFRMLLLVFAVLIAATVLCTACEQAEPQVGTKTITVQIIVDGQDTVTKSITTEAAYLREALEEEKLIAGEESQYGLFVKTVNGVTVDDAKQQWWCFTKGGADLFTGVDTTPIADGDAFDITLKTGY